MQILLTGSLSNDYQQRKRYSTEVAYRHGYREVKQERAQAIIQMTFTKEQSTETILNAQSSEGEICKCNAKEAFPEQKPSCYVVSMTY